MTISELPCSPHNCWCDRRSDECFQNWSSNRWGGESLEDRWGGHHCWGSHHWGGRECLNDRCWHLFQQLLNHHPWHLSHNFLYRHLWNWHDFLYHLNLRDFNLLRHSCHLRHGGRHNDLDRNGTWYLPNHLLYLHLRNWHDFLHHLSLRDLDKFFDHLHLRHRHWSPC